MRILVCQCCWYRHKCLVESQRYHESKQTLSIECYRCEYNVSSGLESTLGTMAFMGVYRRDHVIRIKKLRSQAHRVCN
jgi:hypothetical protein